MDVFAHGFWSAAGARFAKNKNQPISIGWTTFWGVFPDMFAFTIPFATRFYNLLSGHPQTEFVRNHDAPQFALALDLYNYSHSLIIWAMVFIIVWMFFRRPRYELLAWLGHILIDIPTHTTEFFPTPLFFPLSSYHFPYGFSWGVRWFLITNYTALIITWLFLWRQTKKKVRTADLQSSSSDLSE